MTVRVKIPTNTINDVELCMTCGEEGSEMDRMDNWMVHDSGLKI